MGLAGIVCPMDGEFHSFGECIAKHNDPNGLYCNAPRFLLNELSQNESKRKDAKISSTVLTGCARAYALRMSFPYFIKLPSGWNMARGTWAHAMFEQGAYDPEEYFIEQRIRKMLTMDDGTEIPITGQPDEVNWRYGILVDYKTKHQVPTPPVPIEHEAQFNIYAWLLNGGTIITDGPHKDRVVNVEIVRGGMHYISWQPKTPWRRIPVDIWPYEETEAWMRERAKPLDNYIKTGYIPPCNALFTYGKCDCVQMELEHHDYWHELGLI